jgi:cytochrome P450
MVRWVRTPVAMLEQLAATYGPAFSVRMPRMPEPMVFFSDPAAIKDIWTGDPDVLRAGEANVILRSALGTSSLLLLDGLEHLRERRLMLPPFHGDRMRAYGDAMRDATLAELARWKHGVGFPIHGAMQTIAAAAIYLVHRRPDLWPDPARFDPTRFAGKKPDPTHYFPFGGGTRRCLGMAFATFEMKIVLATILARVDVAAASDRVRLVRRGVTLAPSGGMPIVARPR